MKHLYHNIRIEEQEPKQEYETIILLYAFAKERLPVRFSITVDHVVAALLDPAQKKIVFR